MKVVIIGILGVLGMKMNLLGWGIVHDPIHLAETAKSTIASAQQHNITINKWRENITLIKDQVNEMNKLREAIGDPKSAVKRVANDLWEGNEMNYFYEQEMLWEKLKEDADGVNAMRYDAQGLYNKIAEKDEKGNTIERDEDYYKRHDVIEQQSEQFVAVNVAADERRSKLIEKVEEVTEQISNAETEAEILALSAKLEAINGQFAAINHQEEGEFRKLQMQHILNEERKEKEKQDALERFAHEEQLAAKEEDTFLRTLTL